MAYLTAMEFYDRDAFENAEASAQLLLREANDFLSMVRKRMASREANGWRMP